MISQVSETKQIVVCWSLLLASLALLSTSNAASYRRGAANSDSILEIINTQEVERLLAARRLNASRAERRYYSQNGLDDEFPDTNPRAILYESPETSNDIEKPRSRVQNKVDLLMRHYNATSSYQNQDMLNELMFNGHKLLKSSKNALIVTKKQYLKKDWCKTEPLVQRVKEDKCITRTVVNRFCYGQCNSFYIPKNPRKRRTKPPLSQSDEREDIDQVGPAFKSCSFCKPKKFAWISVRLECPTLTPPYRIKRIQRIRQCKCTSADVN